MKKKILSVILVLCMCISLLGSIPVNAATSGTCGDNLTWMLDDNGTFTIDGTGAMNNYWFFDTPWYLNRSNIKSVIINSGVTSIGDCAFRDCANLTNITISDSVESIGVHTFFDCVSLMNVTIPDSVTKVGSDAFGCCTGLISITIPGSLEYIGDWAFENCSALTNVTIGNGITSIAFGMFYGCCKLTSITIPDSVEAIGTHAFLGCESLTSITIPDGVCSIGEAAFSGCNSLTNITIPYGVCMIEETAFLNCGSLKSIDVSADNTGYSSENGVLFNKDKTILIQYPQGKTDTSYTIPDGVNSIGNRAFSYCTNLTSVTIPDSVTNIGEYAFENLKTVFYNGTEEEYRDITTDEDDEGLSSTQKIFFHYADFDGHSAKISDVENDDKVILALYKGKTLTDMQSVDFNSENIEFTSDKQYDTAKVFVWKDFINVEPVIDAIVLTEK